MARLVLLGPAHDAAGTKNDTIEGDELATILDAAIVRYGDEFKSILASSQVWVNGEPADVNDPVGANDVITVLPPVSGG
ncbi:MAG: MoaD/ThiS family protein [Acidimicrobiales bacterium]